MVQQYLAHHTQHSLLPALRSFASNAPSSFSLQDLDKWYSTSDPLHPALAFCALTSAVVFVLGELTGNVSQVDRLWTALPLLYSAHFTFYPYLAGLVSSPKDLDRRILLVFVLQCCWSARLTYQSARRGFLDPRTEDYRWPLVRARLNPLVFKLFNLLFISIAQNVLLLAAELPVYLLLTHWLSSSPSVGALARLQPHHASSALVPLNAADALLALLFLATLAVEMRADNQQQRFQRLKHAALEKQRKGVGLTSEEEKAVQRGFVAEGLWSWSRHPNFAAEQTTWYLLYFFTLLPFLPLSQSITSHPLSTLAAVFCLGAAHPALIGLGGKLKTQAFEAWDKAPSVDALLTAIEHPLQTLRTHASSPSLLLAKARAAYPAFASWLWAEAVRGWDEAKRDEGTLWNYSVVSPVLMSVLFKASTTLTEGISRGKYPLYRTYQSRVAQFWPALTPLKGAWLALSGARRGRAERKLWGAQGAGAGKGLKAE